MVNDNTQNITQEELNIINKFTRREMKEEELYVFPVILCDNDVDRDFERFSTSALHKLCSLFIGKTGICDHEASSKNQAARIYRCEVVEDQTRKNSAGEPYAQLKAMAYLPKSSANEQLILELDAGIKKEVSVGCSVSKKICSICETQLDKDSCRHYKGKEYSSPNGKKVCHVVLDSPTDAYEWSFVAVPAQPKAGVVKGFNANKRGVENKMDVIKKLKNDTEECILSFAEKDFLVSYIDSLKKQADDGMIYRKSLCKDIIRLNAIQETGFPDNVLEKMADELTTAELEEVCKGLQNKADEDNECKRIDKLNKKMGKLKNSQFKI